MEDDIEHPVEPVLDAPVCADGAGEGLGAELGRGQEVAGLALEPAFALDFGAHAHDRHQLREGALVRQTPVRLKPVDVMGGDAQ